jgi:ArsR family transcriptional regulator, arsenate/arsenite/antimonite-responsive transcriptional repressor
MNDHDTQRLEHTARLLRVLGHPMRLAMVEALRDRPWCVCELAIHLGLNKSATSKHLSALKGVGVVDMEKSGTMVNISLAMPCVFDMMYCVNNSNPSEPITTTLPTTQPTTDKTCSCSNCRSVSKENLQDE